MLTTWSVFGGRDDFGPLPVAGGWLDQTQWFADVHRVLSSERTKLLEAKQREAEIKRSAGDGTKKGRRR